MTEQEIMELEGRELDAAVAEYMRGYVKPMWLKEVKYKDGSKGYYPNKNGCLYWVPPIDFSTPRHLGVLDRQPVPHYSTDISAAWPLLEEIHTKPYSVEVFLVHECENEIKYIVNVLLMHEFTEDLMADRSMISVFSDTAPEAICKAYLLWKHEEEEQK